MDNKCCLTKKYNEFLINSIFEGFFRNRPFCLYEKKLSDGQQVLLDMLCAIQSFYHLLIGDVRLSLKTAFYHVKPNQSSIYFHKGLDHILTTLLQALHYFAHHSYVANV